MNIRIDSAHDGMTVKQVLQSLKLSRGFVTHLKKLPLGIMVNGEHATVRRVLREGDTLRLAADDTEDDENENLVPTEIRLDIIYEDDDIIALNKPYNMATHPSIGHFEDTLANGLAYYFAKKGTPFVFRAINRLDRDTSGVVLVAKNRISAARLSECLKSGKIKKTYIALLCGRITPPSGRIDAPIRRKADTIMLREVCNINDEGARSALTEYETIYASERASIVKASPITGRTHQLRVHFAHMGTPIVGDGFYGSAETEPTEYDRMIARQALHAAALEIDLGDRLLTLEAPLPEDMERVIRHITSDMRLCGIAYRSETGDQ